jgi:hypothetical protein
MVVGGFPHHPNRMERNRRRQISSSIHCGLDSLVPTTNTRDSCLLAVDQQRTEIFASKVFFRGHSVSNSDVDCVLFDLEGAPSVFRLDVARACYYR